LLLYYFVAHVFMCLQTCCTRKKIYYESATEKINRLFIFIFSPAQHDYGIVYTVHWEIMLNKLYDFLILIFSNFRLKLKSIQAQIHGGNYHLSPSRKQKKTKVGNYIFSYCVWRCNFNTQSVISKLIVWFLHAQCYFLTQKVISTRKL
jgi:hypothetical protein